MLISTVEEYDKLKNYTPYTFNCLGCGKEVITKKSDTISVRQSQKLFLCKTCKTKKTNLQKYGCEISQRSQLVKDKQKQTCLQRYGVATPFESEDVQKKIKQTNLDRYGVENPIQNKEVKDRFLKSIQSFDREEALNKRKSTIQEKYGVDSVFQSQIIKEKIKQTNLEKYGVDNPSKNSEVKSKIIQTKIERYGEDFLEVSEKIKQFWKNLPEDRRLEILKKKSEIKKQYWQNLTLEQKLEIRRKSNKKRAYKSQDGEVFDSNWELLYYEYCKSKGYNIIREPVGLEFIFENNKHTYYPDFSVEGKLIEVKGNHLKDKGGQWICPYDKSKNGLYEAKRQCALSNGVTILYKEDLEQLGIFL